MNNSTATVSKTIEDFGLTPIQHEPAFRTMAIKAIEAKHGTIQQMNEALNEAEKAAIEIEYKALIAQYECNYKASVKRAKENNRLAVTFMNTGELRELLEYLIAEYGYSGNDYAVGEMARLGVLEYTVKRTAKGVLVGKKTLGEGTVTPCIVKYRFGKIKGETDFTGYWTRRYENGCYSLINDLKEKLNY